MTAARKLPKVQVTNLLRRVLAAEGADPDHFAELKPYLVEVDEKPVCESCIIPAELLKNDEDVDNDDEDDVLN